MRNCAVALFLAATCLLTACDQVIGTLPTGEPATTLQVQLAALREGCRYERVTLHPLDQREDALELKLDAACKADASVPAAWMRMALVAEATGPTCQLDAPCPPQVPPLRAVALHDGSNLATRTVTISPASEIAAAWGVERDASEAAQRDLQARWEAHLGVALQPQGEIPAELSLVSAALFGLAERVAAPEAILSTTPSTSGAAEFFSTLRRDIADGELDGQQGPQPVFVAGMGLAPRLLREGLAETLEHMAPGLGAEDAVQARALARHIAQSEGTLVPRSARPFTPDGAMLYSCRAVDGDGQHRLLTDLQTHGKRLVCRFSGPSPLRLEQVALTTSERDLTDGLDGCVLEDQLLSCRIGELGAVKADSAEFTINVADAHGQHSVHGLQLALLQQPRPSLDITEAIVGTRGDEQTQTLHVHSDRELLAATGHWPQGSEKASAQQTLQLSSHLDPSSGRFVNEIVLPVSPDAGVEHIRLELVDAAGYHIDLPTTLVRHAAPPFIEQLKQDFVGDFDAPSSPRQVNLRWYEPPVALHKLIEKLDNFSGEGTQEHGNPQNLPVLRFAAHSSVPGSDALAAHKALRMEYRLVRPGHAADAQPWRPVPEIQPGEFSLPLAYQTLLPAALLAEPLATIRAENFLARAEPDDVFVVQVRATDVVGNVSDKDFAFTLQLRTAPLVLSGCAATLGSHQVPYPKIVPYLDGERPILTAQLQLKGEAPASSLAPEVRHHVSAGAKSPMSWDARRVRTSILASDRKLSAEDFTKFVPADIRRMSMSSRHRKSSTLSPELRSKRYERVKPHKVYFESGDARSNVEIGSSQDAPLVRHLDGITLFDQWFQGLGSRAEPVALRLNHADATRHFGLRWRLVPQREHEELELSSLAGLACSGAECDRAYAYSVEELQTITRMSLRLPNIRVDVHHTPHGLPPPLSVERDASCGAEENDRIELTFDSANGD